MFVTFDMRCEECNADFPNVFVKKSEVDTQRCKHGHPLLKLPPGTKTTFRYADRRLKR